MRLSGTTTVKDLLDRHPHLLHTFIDLGLMCVGCPTDTFHTLADVAREYGIDLGQLISRMQTAIEEASSREANPNGVDDG